MPEHCNRAIYSRLIGVSEMQYHWFMRKLTNTTHLYFHKNPTL